MSLVFLRHIKDSKSFTLSLNAASSKELAFMVRSQVEMEITGFIKHLTGLNINTATMYTCVIRIDAYLRYNYYDVNSWEQDGDQIFLGLKLRGKK